MTPNQGLGAHRVHEGSEGPGSAYTPGRPAVALESATEEPPTGPVRIKISQAHDEGAFWGLAREVFDQVVLARFTVLGEPVSKARMRFTKSGQRYTPSNTHAAEKAVEQAYRVATGSRPDPDGAFGVIGIFFAATRQRRDVDNMLKLVLDGLNGVAWTDDNQVLEVSGRKEYVLDVEEARTEILVYHLGPMPKWTGNCEHCDKEFPLYRSNRGRRFCSRACDQARRRVARTKPCPSCGQPFVADRQRQDHCSRACAMDGKNTEESCVGCGKSMQRPVSVSRVTLPACSPACRAAHWARNPAKGAKGTCSTCGGPTSKKTYTRCRPCMAGRRADVDLYITEVDGGQG